jgi:flagellar biosynthesis anti-sigma factor FlgM
VKINGQINESDSVNISKPQSDRLSESQNSSSRATRTFQAPGDSSDGVDFGNQNGLLSQTLNAGAADRASRVEQLRALVQSGQYQVDSGALSKSIVDATLNGD